VRMADANLLIYAHVTTFPQHDDAKEWLDGKLNGRIPFGLPWPSVLGFIRLVSNPRVFERPETVQAAWLQVREWLACEAAWIPLQPNGTRKPFILFCPNPDCVPATCPMPIWPPWPWSMA